MMTIDIPLNWAEFNKNMSEETGIKITPKYIGSHLKLLPNDKIINYLRKINYNFQTASNIEDRPFKVVFKGIILTTSENDILNAIKEIRFSPISAKFMRNWQTKKPMPIFVVTI